MRRVACGSEAVTERAERTAQGYRRFRCRACGKQFNERTGTVLNRTQYPSDVVALVVLWRLRYKLSLRDLPEMFAVRGIEPATPAGQAQLVEVDDLEPLRRQPPALRRGPARRPNRRPWRTRSGATWRSSSHYTYAAEKQFIFPLLVNGLPVVIPAPVPEECRGDEPARGATGSVTRHPPGREADQAPRADREREDQTRGPLPRQPLAGRRARARNNAWRRKPLGSPIPERNGSPLVRNSVVLRPAVVPEV